MKKIFINFIFIIFSFFLFFNSITTANTLPINPNLLKDRWPASWIAYPGGPYKDFGVFHFRRTLILTDVPSSFIVHITADNKYHLYVNGQRVCWGPTRGDRLHWRFDTIDLAPYLRQGKNVLAAVVWNFGTQAAWWQVSNQSGFLMQGNTEQESIINTGNQWKACRNTAYTDISADSEKIFHISVVGPGEKVNADLYPWGWEKPEYDDSTWKTPLAVSKGIPRDLMGDPFSEWFLTPRSIPFLEERPEQFNRIARQRNASVPINFLKGGAPYTIPPNTSASILFDQSYLTTAFPELLVSGGKGSSLKLIYAESLWKTNKEKGNRNEIEGKEIRGYYDLFFPDGGRNRFYKPLYWRTFRYVQLEIETKDEPLILESFKNTFCGYPYDKRATFQSSDPSLEKIWEIGWRTLRLCTNETYFDCPYYEQLQYVGDTRIEALVTLYMSGDDRLVKNALELFDESRTPDGLTQSRYPCHMPQYIPTYSLAWINMLHDFWWYANDEEFVKNMVPHTRSVLEWYGRYLGEDDLLKQNPWWNFIDWALPFKSGVPPQDQFGRSSILSLSYVSALLDGALLEESLGDKHLAIYHRQIASRVINAIKKTCWNADKGLFADTPEKKSYSQHPNILAILLDVIPQEEQPRLMEKILNDTSLTKCTFYYQHYLHTALQKVGMGDRYGELLNPWRDMLAMGLTTCPETPEPSRSDCHAWSASPNANLLSVVCGIKPAVPGFKEVKICPNLGQLQWVKATMPHPMGEIQIELRRRENQGLEASVTLPSQLKGTLTWNKITKPLIGGKQELVF